MLKVIDRSRFNPTSPLAMQGLSSGVARILVEEEINYS